MVTKVDGAYLDSIGLGFGGCAALACGKPHSRLRE